MSQQQRPDIEVRTVVRPVERRAEGEGMTVAGYAAVFGSVANIGGYWHEVIARGAFANSLETVDVRAYFDHDSGRVLGRMSSGTLRLAEDNKGLAVEIDLPDTSDGRDVRTLIERGDVSGMSFGFRVLRQEWDETTDPPTRTINEVELHHVAVVSEPAYDGTSIGLRSLEEARREKRQHNFSHASRRIGMKVALDLAARAQGGR